MCNGLTSTQKESADYHEQDMYCAFCETFFYSYESYEITDGKVECYECMTEREAENEEPPQWLVNAAKETPDSFVDEYNYLKSKSTKNN